MPRAAITLAKTDDLILSDSIENDAIIYVSNPNHAIRIGANKTGTSGSPQLSSMCVDPTEISPKMTLNSMVQIDERLEVRQKFLISNGILKINKIEDGGLSDPNVKIHLVGDLSAQDVSVTSNEQTILMSEAIIDVVKDVDNDIISFKRNNGQDTNIQLPSSQELKNLEEQFPPIGTLIWAINSQTNDSDNLFVVADGSEVARNEYPRLFNLFKDRYGQPSSSNVFKLPRMTGYANTSDNLKVTLERNTSNDITFDLLPLIFAKTE